MSLLERFQGLRERTQEKEDYLRRMEDTCRLSDDQLKIISNNSRFRFFGDSVPHETERSLLKSYGCRGSYELLCSLADGGDPLAKKILARYGNEFCPDITDEEKAIVERLLIRRIGRQEYEGYYNGDLPVGNTDGKPIYLSVENPRVSFQ